MGFGFFNALTMKKPKRYYLLDRKYDRTYEYTGFIWNLGWFLVYLFGIITGVTAFR